MKQILSGLIVTIIGGVVVWYLTKPDGTENYKPPAEDSSAKSNQNKCSESFDLKDGDCRKTVLLPKRKFSIPLDKSVTRVSGTLHFRINKERVDFANKNVQHRLNRGAIQVDLPIMLRKSLVGRLTEVIYQARGATVCSISSLPEATGWTKKIGSSYSIHLEDCGTDFAKVCRTNLRNEKRAEILLEELEVSLSEDGTC